MMTVVLKARSQTTQELGRNANYLAPLRPTDSEIPGVAPVMFQAAMQEGGRDARGGAALSPSSPPPLTAGDSLFLSSGNWYKVSTSCTHLSNHTQKHSLLGVKCCARHNGDTHKSELPAYRVYSLIMEPRQACAQSYLTARPC